MILVISPKNVYAAKRLADECRILNKECRILSVAHLAKQNFNVDLSLYSALYIRNPYLNCSPKYISNIVSLAKKFKLAGKKVVDAIITSGKLGNGKWQDYLALQKSGLPIPKTFLETLFDGRQKVFPFILKSVFGFKGKDVHLVRNQREYEKILLQYPENRLMRQEYIEADYEYKVITIGYKALPVVLRFDFNKKLGRVDFNSSKVINLNVVQATGLPKTDQVQAGQGPALQKLVEKSSKILGRELAKVDVLQKGNNFYVLEVNRFPGLKSFEELAKYNVAREFVEYLQK